MPCAKPLTGYRPANGGPISFNRPLKGQADVDYTKITIPCGQCILCRIEHARQWAVRITHEAQLHPTNAFITLTYNDKHLPPYGSLQYADLQKFWKRARKEIGKLRYFAVGEYGDQTDRPHYHACVFGHDFSANRTILRSKPTLLWTNPVLEALWPWGNVSVGALTYETAQYTAAYVTKKLSGKKRYVRLDEETGELVPLEQPRALMSRYPAIGNDWLMQWGKHAYTHDYVIVQGKRHKPPKYYDRWLGEVDKPKLEEVKAKRKLKAKPTSEGVARARAQAARARAKMKKKSV